MQRTIYYILLLMMVLPVNVMGENVVETDSTAQLPEFVQKMTDLQHKMLEKVAESQMPKTGGNKFKVAFMPPPFGSMPEYGFGLGVGVCGMFKTDFSNPTLYTSMLPLNVRFGFTNPFSFAVNFNPTIYFNDNKLKVAAKISYKQMNEHYFGIGYSTNKSLDKNWDITGYQSRRWQVSPEVEWKLGKSNLYMGVVADFIYEDIRKPGSYLLGNAEYLAEGGNADGLSLMDVGAGVDISYDTRDVEYSPYRGVYMDMRAVYYGKFMGSDHDYGKIELDYRQYCQIGNRRSVLAWGVSSSNVIGTDVPFARYATIGDIYTTRGYYGYQYRDKSVLKAHVEYRYMFNFNTMAGELLLNRFGVAGWTGLAALGENVVKYNAVLPEIGAGIRLHVMDRISAHLDFGYDINAKEVRRYFGISEVF